MTYSCPIPYVSPIPNDAKIAALLFQFPVKALSDNFSKTDNSKIWVFWGFGELAKRVR